MSFHPYLFFGGTCREAFTHYRDVFGGRLDLVTAADMQPESVPPGVDPGAIMHAELVTDRGTLTGSDDVTPGPFAPVTGMRVNVVAPDADEAARVFAALADGGSMQLAFAPSEWSPGFGMCTDAFGTPWMVDVERGTSHD